VFKHKKARELHAKGENYGEIFAGYVITPLAFIWMFWFVIFSGRVDYFFFEYLGWDYYYRGFVILGFVIVFTAIVLPVVWVFTAIWDYICIRYDDSLTRKKGQK